MEINEAIKNIAIVTGNAKMTREEHAALDESLRTIVSKIQTLEKQVNVLSDKLAEEKKDE